MKNSPKSSSSGKDDQLKFLWQSIMKKDLPSVKKFFVTIKSFDPLTPLTPVGLNALHQACSVDYLPTIEFLVKEVKINVNSIDKLGRSSLHYAVSHGYLDIVKFLYENGANANSETIGGETPLFKAVQFKQAHVIEFLLTKTNANCNKVDKNGTHFFELLKLNDRPSYEKFEYLEKKIEKFEEFKQEK